MKSKFFDFKPGDQIRILQPVVWFPHLDVRAPEQATIPCDHPALRSAPNCPLCKLFWQSIIEN